jgi:hypothetical protein
VKSNIKKNIHVARHQIINFEDAFKGGSFDRNPFKKPRVPFKGML